MPENNPEAYQGGLQQASPEEQGQYDEFVNNGLKLIFSEENFDAVVERLKAGDDPVDAVAQSAAQIVARLMDSAEQAGAPIPGDVAMHGGVEIVENLADLAGKVTGQEFSADQLEAATYRAMDAYRDIEANTGKLDQKSAQEDWQALQQANQSGELDQMVAQLQQAGPQRRGLGNG